jgi:hypothetical protein
MSVWSDEIRLIATGEGNRSLAWCAEELARASAQLLWDYQRLLAHLRWKRRMAGHRYQFACCQAARQGFLTQEIRQ